MKLKTICGALLAGGLMLWQGNCFAGDNLDTYRTLLLNKTYTVRCETVTSEERVTNRDKFFMIGRGGVSSLYGSGIMQRYNTATAMGRTGLNTADLGEYTYKPVKCFATADGTSHYMEASAREEFVSCSLDTDGKSYKYSRVKKNDSITYIGSKKNEVEGTDYDYEEELNCGQGLGNADVTRLLNAMLPGEARPAGVVKYEKITEGWLDNGLNYIDYRGDMATGFEVIRYYFQGYTLVKIASGIYTMDNAGNVINGRRCIVKVNEFKRAPEAEYLKLPVGVKIKKVKNANKEDN